jgi:hypothetical protein
MLGWSGVISKTAQNRSAWNAGPDLFLVCGRKNKFYAENIVFKVIT